jgi:hypothetical protein
MDGLHSASASPQKITEPQTGVETQKVQLERQDAAFTVRLSAYKKEGEVLNGETLLR